MMTMSTGLSEILASVDREIDKRQRELDRLKRIKAGLLDEQEKSAREEGPSEIPPVKPGQYSRMAIQDALQAYMKDPDRAGHKIPYERGCNDLYSGGAVMQDRGRGAKGRLQNFRMSLSMNKWLVAQDKQAGVFWLADTATEAPKPRKKK